MYKTRRILFALSIVAFVLNLSLIAVFDESMRKNALITILWSAVFAVVQLLDKRKAHWEWLYIIVLCTIFFLLSAFVAFATELMIVRYIWVGEFVLFLGFFFCCWVRKS